jgi:hypothetical protein
LGLASRHRASCTLRRRKGDRSRLAAAKPGVRWRAVDDPAPRGGCASSIPEEGASPGGASRPAGERALVEGRRPGVGEAAVFDETAAEAVPGGFAGKVRPKGRIGSRGIATEGVRSYVASSARGRQRRSREVQRGGAFDRSSARTARHHAHRQLPGVTPEERAIGTGCGKAEAGGSPSSEASPGGSPEAIGRGWVRVRGRASSCKGRKHGGARTRESGNLWGARVCSRLQKLERRIFLASIVTSRGNPGRGAWRQDSLKRPAIL